MPRLPAVLAALSLVVVACSDDRSSDDTTVAPTVVSSASPSTVEEASSPTTSPTTESATESTTASTTVESYADRPYEVFVPSGYDAAMAAPLVILLHGYGASGAIQDLYFQMQPQAEARGFLYVHPDATLNSIGGAGWNATDACCNDTNVNDVGYLMSIIDGVSADYNVDADRVYLVGHSNGGFMSYRTACESADRIAAIVSLAGATFLDTTRCNPSEPVNVLQIHGTNDGTIQLGGGSTPVGAYPSAQDTVASWAVYNGCTSTLETTGSIDIEGSIAGAETTQQAFTDCPIDGAVEFWTINGGAHIPGLQPTFAAEIVDWLLAHPNV